MEKFYKVSKSELIELIHDSMELCALKNGGVEYWDWFSKSIKEFINANENPGDDIYDLAELELENYQEVD